MRAPVVPRDTVDLLVTAILISSTDFTQSPARAPMVASGRSPAAVLADVDRLGQLLWDASHTGTGTGDGYGVPAHRYEWRPVAELLGDRVTVDQILQIECSRRYMEMVCCRHAGWDDSEACRQLRRLEQSIEARLYFHPRESSPQDPSTIQYADIDCAVDQWTRDVGFASPLTVEAAIEPTS